MLLAAPLPRNARVNICALAVGKCVRGHGGLGGQRKSTRRTLRVHADANGGPSGPPDGKQHDEAVRKAVEAMKKSGVDSKIARKVLESMRQQDVTDEASLRSRLIGRGFTVVALAGLQTAVDLLAAYCCATTAAIADEQTWAAAGVVAIAFRLLFYYFLIGAGLDLFRLGTVLGGAVALGTQSATLFNAIESLAGESTGIALVDKAAAAVSTSKVILALNSVRTALKNNLELANLSTGTLSQLRAFFVLQHAADTFRWTPEAAGVTADDASVAAQVFAKYDRNEDFRLEVSELRQLISDADFDLSEAETKAAIQLVDKRGNGFIEFDEFVSWWVDAKLKATSSADESEVSTHSSSSEMAA